MRPLVFSTLFLLSCLAAAQQSVLVQGNMLVQPGTVVQFQGPLDWQVLSNAQVTNNGRIEFIDGATLDEAPGAPLTGTGTEHAWIGTATAVSAVQPGGLGLELTSSAPIGPLQIARGHVPFMLENGDESIARWFKFEEGIPAQLDQLIFHFDATELNGLTGAQLDLHDSEGAVAPWVPMLSFPGTDPLSLVATDLSPREYITAFHFDSTTGINENTASGFSVLPTITYDHVTITSFDEQKITELELFDVNGKRIPVELIGSQSDQQFTLDLSRCDQGPLLLRVNGIQTFKLVKA